MPGRYQEALSEEEAQSIDTGGWGTLWQVSLMCHSKILTGLTPQLVGAMRPPGAKG